MIRATLGLLMLAPVAAQEIPLTFHRDMELDCSLGLAEGSVNDRAYAIREISTLVLIDRVGLVRFLSSVACSSWRTRG